MLGFYTISLKLWGGHHALMVRSTAMSVRMPTVMICDDDALFHLAVKQALKGRLELKSAYHSDEALAILKNQSIDAIFLDIKMRTPEEGLEAIPRLLATDPEVAIIMSSGNTDFGSVKRAVDLGAAGYVPKDFDPASLVQTLDQVLAVRRLKLRSGQQNHEALILQKKHSLVGQSPAVQSLVRLVSKFRASHANVLIQGETGSGKEVVARLLRKTGPEGQLEPFVAVDSSTIQQSTAESALFGHEKGAFTGAERATKGLFEEADGGIIYFDEVGNMPLEIQAKLLRVLQEKEVTRLGSTRPIALEFRVIAATNRDLEADVAAGTFKADLFQRLNVLPVRVPPLREHLEDLGELIAHLVARQGTVGEGIQIDPEVMEAFNRYDWPGNVRELGNLVAYVCAVCEDRRVRLEDLPAKIRAAGPRRATEASLPWEGLQGTLKERMMSAERRILSAELDRCEGVVSRVAESLNVDRSHLHGKLKEHGLGRQARV